MPKFLTGVALYFAKNGEILAFNTTSGCVCHNIRPITTLTKIKTPSAIFRMNKAEYNLRLNLLQHSIKNNYPIIKLRR